MCQFRESACLLQSVSVHVCISLCVSSDRVCLHWTMCLSIDNVYLQVCVSVKGECLYQSVCISSEGVHVCLYGGHTENVHVL